MKNLVFLIVFFVLLVGYRVAGVTRAKSPMEIMELVRDINAVHAKLSVNAARRTYVTLQKLFNTQGALPDFTDPIEREFARMDSTDLAKAHRFRSAPEFRLFPGFRGLDLSIGIRCR